MYLPVRNTQTIVERLEAMPPKQKVQLDKAAWQWSEEIDYRNVTKEHVKQSYRVDLTTCQRGTCKRNCKGNPFCLNMLGERKWFAVFQESKYQSFYPDSERRQKGEFVGLQNLGATCYVNTFLQLWFHDKDVRRAVYEWREADMPKDFYPEWKPKTICGHLQIIFALLQASNRQYIDPSSFIECLGLDADSQQDAQEFSKLFLMQLELQLSNATQKKKTNLIDDLFSGSYNYLIECQGCKSQSRTHATFTELDLHIRGHSTLHASITDFLREENLEGENMYMCSQCESKQKARRTIKLTKLPPILNLQLLRFVFDKNKGCKKKLSSFIQFPESLDMRTYMNGEGSELEDEEANKYELSAVLIHRGATANSGHYIAHIRKGNVWYKFNDKEIDRMKTTSLQLGKEDDVPVSESKNDEAPKPTKGTHSSRNAYMLVYKKKYSQEKDCSTDSVSSDLLPSVVQDYVKHDNQLFEDWIQQMLNAQEIDIQSKREQHDEMGRLYLGLSVRNPIAEPWEWVSTALLTKWLTVPECKTETNNKIVKCPHDKLDVDWVTNMKCITTMGADAVFSQFPVDHRYPGEDMMCEKCVRQKCRNIQQKKCMLEDDKLFTSIKNLDCSDPNQTYYWVSTKHLRSWRKFFFEEDISVFVDKSPDKNSDESKVDDKDFVMIPIINSNNLHVTPTSENGSETSQKNTYNSNSNQNVDMHVNNSNISPRYNDDDLSCSHCQSKSKIGSDFLNCSSVDNTELKTCDLVDSSQTVTGAISDDCSSSCCGRNQFVYNNSRTVLNHVQEKHKEEDTRNSEKFNDDILCVHGKLKVEESGRRKVPTVVWERLLYYFPYLKPFTSDVDICQDCLYALEFEHSVRVGLKKSGHEQKESLQDLYHGRLRPKLSDAWHGKSTYVVSSSFLSGWRKFVKTCVQNDSLREIVNAPLLCEHKLLLYRPEDMEASSCSGFVLVWDYEWQILKSYYSWDEEVQLIKQDQPQLSVSLVTHPGVCEKCLEERLRQEKEDKFVFSKAVVYIRKIEGEDADLATSDSRKGYNYDPEFNAPSNKEGLEPVEKCARLEQGLTRKSKRHRKSRGEKELIISSSMTLKELKIRVLQLFSVLPCDQNLILEGQVLTGDESTLQTLRVYPQCTLWLKADEPSVEDDSIPIGSEIMEQGFKGTNLIGGMVIAREIEPPNQTVD